MLESEAKRTCCVCDKILEVADVYIDMDLYYCRECFKKITTTSGVKADYGKLMYELLPYDALEELTRVYTYGANKYKPRNWEKGISYSRLFAATCRHLFAWWRGIDLDAESGLPHLAHATWNVITLLAFATRGRKDLDDRPSCGGDDQTG